MRKIHDMHQKYLLSRVKLPELAHLKDKDIEQLRTELMDGEQGYAFIPVDEKNIQKLRNITAKLDTQTIRPQTLYKPAITAIDIQNSPIVKQIISIFNRLANEDFILTQKQNNKDKKSTTKADDNLLNPPHQSKQDIKQEEDKQKKDLELEKTPRSTLNLHKYKHNNIPIATILHNPAGEIPHINTKDNPTLIATLAINGKPMLAITPNLARDLFDFPEDAKKRVLFKNGKDIIKDVKSTIIKYFRPVKENGIIIYKGSGKLTDPVLNQAIKPLLYASPQIMQILDSKAKGKGKDKNKHEHRDVLIIKASPKNNS
ncbi:MAG: hypothetical protein RLZZ210_193 [Pseudomonadota bacterium]|jgi:hypothetical protein